MKIPHLQILMTAPKQARIEIYDDIGPSWLGMIDTKLVSSKLAALGDVQSVEVRINSRGGDAWEGLGIANLLKEHPAKIQIVVDGIAASAASLIAMAGDSVRIPKNAILMIHEPWTIAFGDADALRKAIASLEVTTKAGIALYSAKSGKPSEEIAALLKAETWYTGEEAVAAGFADLTDKELPAASAPTKESAKQAYDALRALPLLAMTTFPKPTPEISMSKVNETPETPAVEKPASPPALTQAEAAKIASDAAIKAVADERLRTATVLSLCTQAKKPDLARKYLDEGTPVMEVQAALFKLLCEERKPTDDGGQAAGATQAVADPNDAYKAEYKANPHYAKMGMKVEDYIATRRIDDGLDVLAAKPAA
jgi:ATP-dependent protease ClpP protease subunit